MNKIVVNEGKFGNKYLKQLLYSGLVFTFSKIIDLFNALFNIFMISCSELKSILMESSVFVLNRQAEKCLDIQCRL